MTVVVLVEKRENEIVKLEESGIYKRQNNFRPSTQTKLASMAAMGDGRPTGIALRTPMHYYWLASTAVSELNGGQPLLE